MDHYQIAKKCLEVYDNSPDVRHRGNIQFRVHNYPEHDLIVFRGTDQFSDWSDNYNTITDQHKWGRTHAGFSMAHERVAYHTRALKPTIYAGHSLGGAIAVLAAAANPHNTIEVVTFGCPRVGNSDFVKNYNKHLGYKTTRYVNKCDPVPWLPWYLHGYRHTEGLRWYNGTDFRLHMSIWAFIKSLFLHPKAALKDHMMKNYLDALA